jgi:hypothetical protein
MLHVRYLIKYQEKLERAVKTVTKEMKRAGEVIKHRIYWKIDTYRFRYRKLKIGECNR